MMRLCVGQNSGCLTRVWHSLWSWLKLMRSVRAAVVKRTGIEIKPKVRCPFQTVEAMQKLLCESFPGSLLFKTSRCPNWLPVCKVSRAGAKKARRCVGEATKEEGAGGGSSGGGGCRKCGKQRTCRRPFWMC